MHRFYLAAILAGLAVGCGDGGSIADQPPGAPEGPARFTGVDADGSLVGALPEGAPIRTPENYHPVDEVGEGCRSLCDGDEDCLATCAALCAIPDACAQCLCNNPLGNACAPVCED